MNYPAASKGYQCTRSVFDRGKQRGIKPTSGIKAAVENARMTATKTLPEKQRQQFQNHYFQIVANGYEQNSLPESPPGKKRRGRRKQSKARNLLDRFRNHADKHPGIHE